MVFSFYGDTISLRTLFLNFAKLQIPQITCDDLSFLFIWFCVATIGVCVFGALTSVDALFYFTEVKEMKNKFKQILSLILMITLIINVFAGCEEKDNTQNLNNPVQEELNKWVLTSKETLFPSFNRIEQSDYGYDTYGRINHYRQLHTYDSTIQEYTYSNFSYDNNGNVLTYTETKNYDNETKQRLCEFEYDNSSRLIKSTTIYSDSYKEIVEFEYDDNCNITKKSSKELIDGELDGEKIDYEYTLTYENNLCIIAEIVATINEYDSGTVQYTDTEYLLEKYYYDLDNNKVKSEHYYEDTDTDTDSSDVIFNGKYYRLETTTTYTWEKLSNINTEKQVSNLGFNNVDEWGNILVRIEPDISGNYICNDDNGKYVVVMKDNNVFWEFYPAQNQFLTNSLNDNYSFKNSDVSTYSVLNNDRISVTNPYESYTISIVEKFQSKNIPIFKTQISNYEYFIPYEYIDTSKDFAFFKRGEIYNNKSFDYYKLYLK